MPLNFQTSSAFDRLGGFRQGLLGWPMWARYCLLVPMVPGILILALSIVLFVGSLVALFVLTAPVYALLDRLFSVRNQGPVVASPRSKRVEATVRDA